MDTKSTNSLMSSKKLRFMESSEGSEEFTSIFRNGMLRYLVPLSAVFMVVYIGVNLIYTTPITSFAFILLSICGSSIALSRLGYNDFSLRLFLFGCIGLLCVLNYPSAIRPNGFATGGIYLFCLIPIIWWMSFSDRRSRLAILGLICIALVVVAAAGQHENSSFEVPKAIFIMGLIRCFFIIAITMGIGQAIEISIIRFENRWKESFEQQNLLTLQTQNQTRNLERAAAAHEETLAHLTRSENRYRKLFDNAFDGIVIYDALNDRPIEINDTFCEVLGYSQKEMRSLGPVEISPELQADGRRTVEVRAEVKTKLDAGEDLHYPWRHVSRFGALIDFEIYTFCIPGEDHIRVSLMQDVTLQNRTKLALEEANRELRTFAHAASHDLKEPLRTMSNFAKLIDRRYADKLDDSGREYISYITDAAARGTTLVTDLLRFAEVGTDQISTEIVSLNKVAATVQQTVSARIAEEGASLTIADLPEVIATPTWSQQLLQNLISNALKFKREGVTPEVKVFAKTVDSSYEIYVQDNGIGIAEENLEKVFGVFERLNLRENFEGNGIGLALCQRIMKKLGGNIRVESTFGVGTTFILSFPMLSPERAVPVARKVEA